MGASREETHFFANNFVNAAKSTASEIVPRSSWQSSKSPSPKSRGVPRDVKGRAGNNLPTCHD